MTIETLIEEARDFCTLQTGKMSKDLYGITDGKAIGTYIEKEFKRKLSEKFNVRIGSSSKGLDFYDENINTDIKVTSIRQPQSSCPFKDAKQKIFGLGYNILLFVYDKEDDQVTQTSCLNFVSCNFITARRTADYTTTFRLRQMITDGANKEDIIGFLLDKNIPADEITLDLLSDELISRMPEQGYLTISNALQWRLQYNRVVMTNEEIDGITNIIKFNNGNN
jgi:hypothetical protein